MSFEQIMTGPACTIKVLFSLVVVLNEALAQVIPISYPHINTFLI
jgi:hypothetical protein